MKKGRFHRGMNRELIRSARDLRHRIFGIKHGTMESRNFKRHAKEISSQVADSYRKEFNDPNARISAVVFGSAAVGAATSNVWKKREPKESDLDLIYFISNSCYKGLESNTLERILKFMDKEQEGAGNRLGVKSEVAAVCFLDQLVKGLKKPPENRFLVRGVAALFFPAVRGSLLPERMRVLSAIKNCENKEQLWRDVQKAWSSTVIEAMRNRPKKPKMDKIKLMDFEEICKLYGV